MEVNEWESLNPKNIPMINTIENDKGSILLKQIAGALARRICNYAAVGTKFDQTAEYGFIKFGSRVDLLLPLDAKINCKIGDVVKGGISVLANW